MSGCAHRDDAGAYVLGALADDEQRPSRRTWRRCEACRREVAELQVAADALPLAAEQVEPPPELSERIMAVVALEAELLQRRRTGADAPQPEPAARASAGGAGAGRSRCARCRPRWPPACSSPSAWSAASCCRAAATTSTVTGTGARSRRRRAARASLQLSDDATQARGARHPAAAGRRVYQVWLKRPARTPRADDALFRVDATAAPTSRSGAGD